MEGRGMDKIMRKYIDADELTKRVTKLITSARQNDWPIAEDYLERVINIIKSLQQERPEFVNEIWHKVNEEANLTRPIVLSDGDKYMSPPCTFPFKDMPGFVNAMNKKYKADYTIWAYMDDLLNITSLQQAARNVYESWMGGTMDDIRRDMVELGKVLNARKP